MKRLVAALGGLVCFVSLRGCSDSAGPEGFVEEQGDASVGQSARSAAAAHETVVSTPSAVAESEAARKTLASMNDRAGWHMPSNADASPGRAARAVSFVRIGERLRPEFAADLRNAPPRPAMVTLPLSAVGAFEVEDAGSAVRVAVEFESATDAPAEVSDGFVVYRHGHVSGADVIHRVQADGTEDYLAFEMAPPASEVRYQVTLDAGSGLRLVENVLEIVDAQGVPRLRVARPWIADAAGKRYEARLDVEGCAVDQNPAAPWTRAITAPGAKSCAVVVRWAADMSYPALLDPTWTTTGSLITAREAPRAVLLGTGDVLVFGGNDSAGTGLTSSELYKAGAFAATGSLLTADVGDIPSWGALALIHSGASAGTDAGKVLFRNMSALECELYSPSTGQWTLTDGPTQGGGGGYTLTALASGKVLAAGESKAFTYDPSAAAGSKWQPTAGGLYPLTPARQYHTANLLTSGKVFLAGGASSPSTSAIYDPATNAFTAGPNLLAPRSEHHSATLSNGRVLLAGPDATNSCEVYDPAASSSQMVMTGPWPINAGKTVALFSSDELTTFGTAQALGVSAMTGILYDDATRSWQIAGTLNENRIAAGLVALSGNTQAIVMGGAGPTAGAELFTRYANGQACATGGECASGFCVDGYCCNTACTGLCQACSAAKMGQGTNGTCGSIKAATDPDNECIGSAASSCGTDGSCNGAGACELYASGTICQAAACADSTTLTKAYQCDGAGTCVSQGTSACIGYLCAGSACRNSCQFDTDCQASYFCRSSDGSCQPDQANGATCSSGSQCSSGNCVDGRCCVSACNGACQTCSATPGTCTSVKSADDTPECSGTSTCDASGACAKKNGQICTVGSDCASGLCVDGYCCNSACGGGCDVCSSTPGTCTTLAAGSSGANPSCGAYLCSGAAVCPTTCASDTNCATGYYCSAAGSCAARKTAGQSCNLAAGQDCVTAGCRACQSGNCVDGVCCDSACGGACDVCSAALGASTNGTCSPAPLHAAGSPSCGAYTCNGTSTSCATGCATDADCSAAYYCSATRTCVPRKTKGSVCSLAAGADCLEASCRVCSSGFCADGVCCDSACGGQCDACSAALGASVDGTCTVLAGTAAGSPTCAPFKCSGTTATCASTCGSDAQCALAAFCNASSQCQPDQSNGSACTASSQCTSGSCVDGVCCESACGALCEACSAAKKGGGLDGTCGPVAAAIDPDNECADDGASTCKHNGFCDGNRQCALYAAGASCGSTTCSGNTVHGQICNGQGTCGNDATGVDCAPYLCQGTGCLAQCASDADCVGGAFCNSNQRCQNDQAIGATCTQNSQCTSGFCVDGVCCESSCTGQCQACSAAKKGGGSDGTCGAIASSTDPDNECADAGVSTCGQNGSCNGSGQCALYARGAACGATLCSGNSVIGQVCDGQGACGNNSTGVDCAPYLCVSGACGTSCTSSSDCATGAYCTSAGVCAALISNGDPCTKAASCKSGFCADGMCCGSSCTGQCEACNEPSQEGTCVPVSGAPRGTRKPCDGDPATCGGECNGTQTDSCVYAPATKSCGSTCDNGNETPSSCDGLGACNAGQPRACSPYECGTTSCLTACGADSDCATGYRCSTIKTCVPAAAATCGADGHTLRAPNGVTTDCAPFRCEGTSCRTTCVSVDDCVAPAVCTSDAQCVAPPDHSGSNTSSGCGCRVAGSNGSHDGRIPWAASLGLALLIRRRRRVSSRERPAR